MNTKTLTLLTIILTMFMAVNVMAIQPFGANYTQIKTGRAPMDPAQDHEAIAGNVTELDIFGYSPTQSWQGYYGNVSGTIQLADALDNVMYNWSLASPEGEVYATTITTVNWSGVQCFDIANDHDDLETLFNIASDDVDGVNETFATGNAHDMFYTNNIQFTEGECPSTSIYDADDTALTTDDNNFEEVLLSDGSSTTSVIFTAILDEEDVSGFDNAYHDFEMLVLEDGHGTDIATTTYYFYVELE